MSTPSESPPPAPERSYLHGLFLDPTTGSPRRAAMFVVCILAALGLTWWIGSSPELTAAARRGLFILLLAGLLWVTEAIPAFAVGILVIGLQIALLGRPGGVFATSADDWERFVGVMGHPLIWLFFGGFVLAAGMQRSGLDRLLASNLLSRFGTRPPAVLLGVMTITFVLSMFMSNTATTAMMLAILTPVVGRLDDDDRLGAALLLGAAVAANLGGMGSLIGSPPNAIAVGALAKLEPPQTINFLEWLVLGFPPAAAATLIGWLAITRLYPSKYDRIDLTHETPDAATAASPTEADVRWRRPVVAATMLVTIGLWLTSQWHGIPTAAVSFVPIVVLTTTGVLGVNEIRGLSYDVLFLLAGGLALGQMVTDTGLSSWIVGQLPLEGVGQVGLMCAMALIAVVLSNFMSNTAAANILVPLGVALAGGFEAAVAVPVAFGGAAAMCLPVATPPNAMVYATGRCRASDFVRIGLVLGVVAPLLGILWLLLVLEPVLARL